MIEKNEMPPLISLGEILNKLDVEHDKIEMLTDGLLKAKFFDNFTKYEDENDILKLIGANVVTGEENYIFINLKDSTLEYHEITNGINRVRKYLSNGLDLSLIKQL